VNTLKKKWAPDGRNRAVLEFGPAIAAAMEQSEFAKRRVQSYAEVASTG
jgi:hypothetical protein